MHAWVLPLVFVAWLDCPTFYLTRMSLIWLVCACTCLSGKVATFWYSSCLAMFTGQTVATVYLSFLACSCAAALAWGRCPGSISMCTSMYIHVVVAWPIVYRRHLIIYSTSTPQVWGSHLQVSLWENFFLSFLFLLISFLLAWSSQLSPPLHWAGWVDWRNPLWKKISCYFNHPLSPQPPFTAVVSERRWKVTELSCLYIFPRHNWS